MAEQRKTGLLVVQRLEVSPAEEPGKSNIAVQMTAVAQGGARIALSATVTMRVDMAASLRDLTVQVVETLHRALEPAHVPH
jgi:hypothetical protein